MNETSVVPYQQQPAPERYSVSEVIEQVQTIQEIMGKVMKDGTHYGVIPGTDKPTLYKPGAEKLSLTFRIAPRYFGEDNPKDLGRGHREYVIRCELYHIPTSRFLGAGVGSCSTMESKYRYRDAFEVTGKPVPKAYWDDRNASLIGGLGFRPKKIDGQWQIVKVTERQENPDIADTYNTVLKMAKKRAHIDAVLTATAASDIFTQDLEDALEEPAEEKKTDAKPKPEAKGKPKSSTNDAWRTDFKAAMIGLVKGIEANAIEFLGRNGFESFEQVPSREEALKLHKALQSEVDRGA